MKNLVHVFNFALLNKGNKTVDVFIDGDIVDASTQQIMKMWFGDETSTSYKSFRDLLAKEDADIFNIYINSPGGIVTDAMAMHDLLVEMQNKGKTVNTIGRGLIASSATLILLAGKEPEMSDNSMFMMHTVSGGMYGTVDQMESYAAAMRKFNNQIVDLYANRTGLSKDAVDALMVKETWLTAQEAKDQKFIFKKTDKVDFKNKISEEAWPFQNKAILNSYNNSVTKEDNDMKKFIEDMGTKLMEAIKGIAKPNTGDPAKDHTELMNAIGTTITNNLNTLSDGFDTAIETAVVAKLTDAVNTAVTAKVKDLTEQVTGLETEIENMKGSETKPPKEEGIKAIGGFNS